MRSKGKQISNIVHLAVFELLKLRVRLIIGTYISYNHSNARRIANTRSYHRKSSSSFNEELHTLPDVEAWNTALLLAAIPTSGGAPGFETQVAHSSDSHHAPFQRDLSVGPVMHLYFQKAGSSTPEPAALHICSKPDQPQWFRVSEIFSFLCGS